MSEIQIILGSTRQGRQGEKVARWVLRHATQRPEMNAALTDLRDWPFPFYDSPFSPAAAKGDYGSDLANRWAQHIGHADGFILVTPEYNHGYPAVLKNALDTVYAEWNKKPVAFVSYSGGPGAGIRAVEQLRQVAVELQMVPLRQAVLIPSVSRTFDEAGDITDESYTKRLGTLFDQLIWWADLLRQGRVKAS